MLSLTTLCWKPREDGTAVLVDPFAGHGEIPRSLARHLEGRTCAVHYKWRLADCKTSAGLAALGEFTHGDSLVYGGMRAGLFESGPREPGVNIACSPQFCGADFAFAELVHEARDWAAFLLPADWLTQSNVKHRRQAWEWLVSEGRCAKVS